VSVAPAQPVTVLSLATGVGGIELGLRLAGLRTRLVACVERDPYAAVVLLARMEDETLEPAPVWCGNLEQFDARPFAGVALVCAGYPCPAMSTAGKRLGQRDPRWLWPEVARVVAQCRPAYVFLENVGGHLRLAFDDVWSDLGAMGYEREAGLFSAAEVGAPHERERLFVLAYSNVRQPEFDAGRWAGCNGAGSAGAHGEPDGSGEELADAGSEGREWFRPAEAQRFPVPARNGAELADAPSLSEREPDDEERAESRQRARFDTGWGSLGPFPPGPGDRAGWAYVLARVPEAQPAVCELAARVPARMDRLRINGNAVVPLVAAHAFRTLAGRLGLAESLGVTA
jgi:DNA (cytosine-5)-methyltransferase 1